MSCSNSEIRRALPKATQAIRSIFGAPRSVRFLECTFEDLPRFVARLRQVDEQRVMAVVKGSRVKVTWQTSTGRFWDEFVEVK